MSNAQAITSALKLPVDQFLQIRENAKFLGTKTVLAHHHLIYAILGQAEKELMVPYYVACKAIPPKVRRTSVNSFEPAEITAILQTLECAPII